MANESQNIFAFIDKNRFLFGGGATSKSTLKRPSWSYFKRLLHLTFEGWQDLEQTLPPLLLGHMKIVTDFIIKGAKLKTENSLI